MTSNNPAESVNPNSLQELFLADPQSLSEQDIRKLIAHYREKRALWQQAEASKTKRTVGKKALPENLSLDDLLA